MKRKLSLIIFLSTGIYIENDVAAMEVEAYFLPSVASEESATVTSLLADLSEKSIAEQQKAMDDARHQPGQLKVAEAIGTQMQAIIDEAAITVAEKDKFIRSFAKIKRRLDKGAQSIKMLRDWIGTDQASMLTRLTYADILDHNKKSIKALAEWRKLATIQSGDSLSKYVRAKALISLGNVSDGDNQCTYYRAACAIRGISNELKAQAYIGLGNSRDGGEWNVEYYRAVLDLEGISNELRAKALIGLGNARDCGEWNVEYYHAALDLEEIPNEQRAQAYIGLGNAQKGKDQVKHYRAALDLEGSTNEQRARAYIGLGNTLCGQKKNIEGMVYYYKADKIKGKPQVDDKIRATVDNKKKFVETELKFIRDRRLHLKEDERKAIEHFFPKLLEAYRVPARDILDAQRSSRYLAGRDRRFDKYSDEGDRNRDRQSDVNRNARDAAMSSSSSSSKRKISTPVEFELGKDRNIESKRIKR